MMDSEKDDNSTFRLGVETIRVINDGELSIYKPDRGPTQFQSFGVRPVLSLEEFPFIFLLLISGQTTTLEMGKWSRTPLWVCWANILWNAKSVTNNSTKTLRWDIKRHKNSFRGIILTLIF